MKKCFYRSDSASAVLALYMGSVDGQTDLVEGIG